MDTFKVKISLPVNWADMDAFQHVNNGAFFRYFESARIEYLTRIKFIEYMKRASVGPILAKTSCTFIRPLFYPDKIDVFVRTKEFFSHGMIHEYRVVRSENQEICAIGMGSIVAFDYKMNLKTALPDEIKNAVEDLEEHPVTFNDTL